MDKLDSSPDCPWPSAAGPKTPDRNTRFQKTAQHVAMDKALADLRRELVSFYSVFISMSSLQVQELLTKVNLLFPRTENISSGLWQDIEYFVAKSPFKPQFPRF